MNSAQLPCRAANRETESTAADCAGKERNFRQKVERDERRPFLREKREKVRVESIIDA